MVTERGSPPTEPASPVFMPGPIPRALGSTTPDPLEMPKVPEDEIPSSPKRQHSPSLALDRQPHIPPPLPATVGSEKRSTSPVTEPLAVPVLPQKTAKPVWKPVPATSRAPQKSGGWGSWGSPLLANIASAVTVPDRSPSPEPFPIKPKIGDLPKELVPNQTLKSQPAGLDSSNKPARGGSGSLDHGWGTPRSSRPSSFGQKKSAGPAWGSKPPGSTRGQVISTPDPSTPDPDNADDGLGGGSRISGKGKQRGGMETSRTDEAPPDGKL